MFESCECDLNSLMASSAWMSDSWINYQTPLESFVSVEPPIYWKSFENYAGVFDF
jgi:hypothetical protein